MDDHLLDQGMVDEELGNLLRMLRGDQNVEIPDRLLATPEAPPLAELSHCFVSAQIREQLLGQHRHHIDAEATRMLAVILDRLQQLRLGLLPESRQLRRFPLLADPLQILHRGDPQLVMERLDLFGSQALQFKQFENPLGEGALQLLVIVQFSGGHQFRDLLGDRLADPLDLAETPLVDQGLDRLTQGLQRPGGVRVSPDLEGVLPLQLKQLGNMLQDFSNMGRCLRHGSLILARQSPACHPEPPLLKAALPKRLQKRRSLALYERNRHRIGRLRHCRCRSLR